MAVPAHSTAGNGWKMLASKESLAAIALSLLGILLRLRQYLTGRSLWTDEAMLALNIVNRNFGEFLQPLEYDQGAPVGFLLVEKIFNMLLGRSEFALRLFPFLMGILSVWLFHLLLKRVTSGVGLLAALALFVLNPRLVYYSSEVKQYIVDVVICIALLLIASPFFDERGQKRHFAWLAVAGFLALWFSHPSIFVLTGIGVTLFLVYLYRREYAHMGYILGIGLLWLGTIALLYFLILQDIQQNMYMQEYWRGAFLPLPPWSEPGWFQRSLSENIGLQFGIPYAVYLIFGLMLGGWVVFWLTRRVWAAVIGMIFMVTLAASALGLYPVFERMILFLVPIGILLLGKTIEALYQKLQNPRWLGGLAAWLLVGFLVYGPLVTSIDSLLRPKYFEHIHPSMQFLSDTWREGDGLYVTHGAVPAFEYYAPAFGLGHIPYLTSQRQDYQQPQRILDQLDSLQGNRRVWILMSHVYELGDFNEQKYILDHLKQNGTRRREFREPGTSVYLYLFDLAD